MSGAMSRTKITYRSFFILAASLLLLTFRVDAQSLSKVEKEAIEAFDKRDFQKALTSAEALLSANNQRVDVLFIAAESAHNLRKFDLAEIYFSRINPANRIGRYSVTDLRLAEIKAATGKCEEAKRFYQNYLLINPDPNDLFSRIVKEKIDNCKVSTPLVQSNVSNFNIKPLGKNINTPYHDIAPQRYADKIYFTTAVPVDGNMKPVNRIFYAVREESPKPFVETPKLPGLQVANAALTPEADRIYYTICKDENFTTQEQCEIWYRDRTYEGAWSYQVRLPRHINLAGYTATQPNIGFDRPSNKQILYFVSNRPGGKGKLDIWSSVIERDGTFGEPVCLPFNTMDDEVTPFFFSPNQSLYFSSNSSQGLGGHDVYIAGKAATGNWTRPQILEGINTAFDEIYFYLHQGSHTGYFASNRPNAGCPEPITACRNFDLYEVHTFSMLDVSVFNAVDSTALTGSTLELMDLGTGFIDTTCVRIPVNNTKLGIGTGKAYRLIVSQPGYYPVYADIEPQQVSFLTHFEKKVFLKPMRKGSAPAGGTDR